MTDWIGWVASAAFAASYIAKNPVKLRCIQAAAALLWIAYGVTMKAAPVVVANLVVASMAVFSVLRGRIADKRNTGEGAINDRAA